MDYNIQNLRLRVAHEGESLNPANMPTMDLSALDLSMKALEDIIRREQGSRQIYRSLKKSLLESGGANKQLAIELDLLEEPYDMEPLLKQMTATYETYFKSNLRPSVESAHVVDSYATQPYLKRFRELDWESSNAFEQSVGEFLYTQTEDPYSSPLNLKRKRFEFDNDDEVQPLDLVCVSMEERDSFPKELDDNMVQVGSRGTIITRKQFVEIDWSTEETATRTLMNQIFPEEIMATHTLTGKFSVACSGRERRLNEDNVADIIECLRSKFYCESEHRIRAAISARCSAAARKMKYRQSKNFQYLPSANMNFNYEH